MLPLMVSVLSTISVHARLVKVEEAFVVPPVPSFGFIAPTLSVNVAGNSFLLNAANSFKPSMTFTLVFPASGIPASANPLTESSLNFVRERFVIVLPKSFSAEQERVVKLRAKSRERRAILNPERSEGSTSSVVRLRAKGRERSASFDLIFVLIG